MDISKTISDFLRQNYPIGASHARELAAAFLGYKSHSTYLFECNSTTYSLERIEVLIPELRLLQNRIVKLKLQNQFSAGVLAKAICDELIKKRMFRGSALIVNNQQEFEEEMHSGFLINNVCLEDELSHLIAETNAWFNEEYYQKVSTQVFPDEIVVEASGTFYGENDDERDKPNHGDKIDFSVELKFKLEAWKIGYSLDIETDGKVLSPY